MQHVSLRKIIFKNQSLLPITCMLMLDLLVMYTSFLLNNYVSLMAGAELPFAEGFHPNPLRRKIMLYMHG